MKDRYSRNPINPDKFIDKNSRNLFKPFHKLNILFNWIFFTPGHSSFCGPNSTWCFLFHIHGPAGIRLPSNALKEKKWLQSCRSSVHYLFIQLFVRSFVDLTNEFLSGVISLEVMLKIVNCKFLVTNHGSKLCNIYIQSTCEISK